MLQRIQTIFLLLAIGATSMSFLFPIANISIGGKVSAWYTNYGLKVFDEKGEGKIVESGFIYIIAAAVLLFLLVALTQYKRRNLQMRICRLTYLLCLVQFAMCFFMPDMAAGKIKFAGEVAISGYGLGFYAPIIALLCTFAAERFIKKDDDLVRSADRLR